MTDAEINSLQNDIGKLREQHPEEWVRIMFQSAMVRMSDKSLMGLRHRDFSGEPDAYIVLLRGRDMVPFGERVMAELKELTNQPGFAEDL